MEKKAMEKAAQETMKLPSGEGRGSWSNKLDFVMSALSFAVGMGNLWRFPYLCYKNGGGAFLIPYVVMMGLCGYPLMFLELSLGQYARQGIVNVWKAVPLLQGIGWGMLCISSFTCIYYNVPIAWCFYYLFSSFAKELPWATCDNPWNTPECTTFETIQKENNCTTFNGTWQQSKCHFNMTSENVTSERRTSPSEEFFHNFALQLDESSGLGDLGVVHWPMALCLLLCWALVFLSLAKGIRVSGKVTYITALFPYAILLILLVRGVTLEGAMDGIRFYLTPQWHKLLSAKVWADAAMQAFFSLSLCWGGMITLASFNNFKNNCLRDTLIVATGDMLTSILSGFVIFAVIGFMAHEMQLPVSQVAAQGPGLAFVVYPQVVTKLPVPQLWSALFMVMLINVGMGTQMGTVATIQNTLVEVLPWNLERGRRPLLVLLVVCTVAYSLGLLLTTYGGTYLLVLMDNYCASYALLFLALFECIGLAWIYGAKNFSKDIELMIGNRPNVWWRICWQYLTPVVIIFLIISVILDFKRSSYQNYVFPIGWEIGGSLLSLISIICVPVTAILKIISADSKLSILEKIKCACRPTAAWLKIYESEKSSSGHARAEVESLMHPYLPEICIDESEYRA